MNASNSSGLNTLTNLTSTSVQLSSTTTLSALARVTSVLQSIYFLIDAYLIPFYLTFVIINNLLCLSVFLLNSEFQKSHSTNARYYYTFLAVIDIIAVYDWEFPFFTGDGLNYASGGTIYWYKRQNHDPVLFLFLFYIVRVHYTLSLVLRLQVPRPIIKPRLPRLALFLPLG